MKTKRIVCILLSVLIIASVFSIPVFASENNSVAIDLNADFSNDRVIIQLENNSSLQAMERITKDSFGVSCSAIRLLNPSKLNSAENEDGFSVEEVTDTQNDTFVLTLKDKGKENVIKSIEVLNNNPAIKTAEPDYYSECASVPNDLYYYQQDALEIIQAEDAWDYTRGDEEVVVGIIDSGIQGTHPDLNDNLWNNPDSNEYGYVNDIHGYNFVNRVGGTPTDYNGHGTQVAGIVGAKGNNYEGICGVNWNVSLAWLGVGNDGNISDSAVVEALNYANLHDIMIVNCSWSSNSYSSDVEKAIRNYRGLFVASAGNNGNNIDGTEKSYPACYDSPNILAVASTTLSDELSSDTNYGFENVDIAAPGEDIYTTDINSSYDYASGSSMAAAHVSGVAALIKSEYPGLSTSQLKTAILSGADVLENLEGKVATSGRLNACESLLNARNSIDVYFQNKDDWTTPTAYFWSDGGLTPVVWPGTPMTNVSGDIYKVTIPYSCNKIIFSNNGRTQTQDLNVQGNNHLYIPTSSTWITYNPDDYVTVYFQNESNWTTPTAYYWEDGGYLTSVAWPGEPMEFVKANIYKVNVPSRCDKIIFSDNGSIQTTDQIIPGDGKIYRDSTSSWDNFNIARDKSVTVYFTNNNNWNEVKAYLWNSATSYHTYWPGESMVYVGQNELSENIYSITFDSNMYDCVLFTGKIMHNLQQTVDITGITKDSDGIGYYVTTSHGNSVWDVQSYWYRQQ